MNNYENELKKSDELFINMLKRNNRKYKKSNYFNCWQFYFNRFLTCI